MQQNGIITNFSKSNNNNQVTQCKTQKLTRQETQSIELTWRFELKEQLDTTLRTTRIPVKLEYQLKIMTQQLATYRLSN